MGVRDIIPDSIAFVIVVQIASNKPLRVRVLVNVSERLLFLPSGILSLIGDRWDTFIEQLSESAAWQLAYLKWDRADPLTEYCELQILTRYQLQRLHLRFSFILQPGLLRSVEELSRRSWIRLLE